MKHALAIAFIFCSTCILRAQDRTTSNNNVILHAEAGYSNFQSWKLGNMFIAGGGERFPAFQTIGIGGLVSVDYGKYRFEANYAFHYFLPFKNEAMVEGIQVNARLQGWEFMWCKDGVDIFPAKLFDLSGSIGFAVGNLRLDWNNQLYKNPFIAPVAKIDARINFWKLSIGARASYRFDLTYGNWKRKSSGMTELPDYKFREFQGLVYIGWIIYSQ